MNPSPLRGRLYRFTFASIGVLAGLAIAFSVRESENALPLPRPRAVQPTEPCPPAPINAHAVRTRAWERAEQLLTDAEQGTSAVLDRHLATVAKFLAERKQGTKAFASRLLGLRGKWELIRSKLRQDDDNEYAKWLYTQFSVHVFQDEELRQTVEACARACLSELQGLENQLLIRLRADLSDQDLSINEIIPALRSDAVFRQHYDSMMIDVLPMLDRDLKVMAGREVASFVVADLATAITMRIGSAVMARLGVSTGILATGAASSGWATFGIGLVVSIAVDQVIGQIMTAAGYDPEERIATRINETLDDLGRVITDGDPEARSTLETLKRMEQDDPATEVRAACSRAIRLIEGGSRLNGLRGELTKINAARTSLRKEALSRLIRNPEAIP